MNEWKAYLKITIAIKDNDKNKNKMNHTQYLTKLVIKITKKKTKMADNDNGN